MRSRAALITVLVAALTVGALKYFGVIWPGGGPLHPSAGNASGMHAKPGTSVAMSFFPRPNSTDDPLEFRSIRLLEASPGLKLLGSGVFTGCRGGGECSPSLSYRRWPPARMRLAPVPGHRVEPGGNAPIVVGLRPRGEGRYRLRGILLTYRRGWREFEVEVGPRAVIDVSDGSALQASNAGRSFP